MKISELCAVLNGRIINLENDTEVRAGYCGDFLSNVISKAPSGGAWFTVMANVNTAGVATLAEIAVTVLCEGVKPDNALSERIKEQKLNFISTDLSVFAAAVRFAQNANLL